MIAAVVADAAASRTPAMTLHPARAAAAPVPVAAGLPVDAAVPAQAAVSANPAAKTRLVSIKKTDGLSVCFFDCAKARMYVHETL